MARLRRLGCLVAATALVAGTLTFTTQSAQAVPPPTVTVIGPTSGPTTGGTRVTVIGTNFINVRSVHFGGAVGSGIHLVSSTKLLVTAPAHFARTIDVQVTTAQGTSAPSAGDRFTFAAPPTVTSIGPATGLTTGGTRVTVNGTNFIGVSYVTFGTARGASIHLVGTTRLLITAPPHAPGVVNLQVHAAGGTSAAVTADRFTYVAPVQKVTGRVTSTTGAPLQGVVVHVSANDDGSQLAPATTQADGTYAVTGLVPNREYTVCFATDGVVGAPVGGYIPECWAGNGIPTAGRTDVVYVPVNGTKSGVDAALQVGGTIAGTVRDTAGHPLTGVDVILGDAAAVRATTGADGSYRIVGVQPGTETVCFDPAHATGGSAPHGYEAQCFRGEPDSIGGGDHVGVLAGQVTAGVDAALFAASSVSGTVTGPGGVPLAGVDVSIQGGNSATTGADGTYTVIGDFYNASSICFTPPISTPYRQKCSQTNFGIQTDVLEIDHVDMQFGIPPVSVTIHGKATDSGGHPLANVLVTDGSQGIQADVQTMTAADGTYTLNDANAGQYFLCFEATPTTAPASPGGYLDTCGVPVNVAAGQTENGVNAVLAHGGGVSGTITDTAGHPLPGVGLSVGSSQNSYIAVTDANGHYSLTGLPPAANSYALQAQVEDNGVQPAYTGGPAPPGYLNQCWNGKTYPDPCDKFSVVAGATTTVSMKLQAAGAIAGTVTDTTGHPLDHVFVSASPYYLSTYTDATGHYEIDELHPGTNYSVCFNPVTIADPPSAAGYSGQCWKNIPSGTGTSTPVAVTLGAVTGGIDAQLVPVASGSISGTVTDAANRPLQGIYVSSDIGAVRTAADGTYTLPNLTAGTHTVCFEADQADAGSTTGFQAQCYNGAALGDPAAPVAVTAGQTTAGIDAVMQPAGAIAGTVTDSDGTPLSNVEVQYYGPPQASSPAVYTDAAGHYRIVGLTPGQVTLHFQPGPLTDAGTYGVGDLWSGGVADQASATPVTETGGATTTSDIVLPLLGAISGKLTDFGARPLPFAFVSIGDSSNFLLSYGATTQSDGTFQVTGIVPGTNYTVCFSPVATASAPYGAYSGCFGQTVSTDPPTPVSVSAGNLTANVTMTVARLGALSETVSDPQGDPLSGVAVALTGPDPNFNWTGSTDGYGKVTFIGLAPGTYSVAFQPFLPAGGQSQSYQWTTRDNVVVTGGTLTTLTPQVLQPQP